MSEQSFLHFSKDFLRAHFKKTLSLLGFIIYIRNELSYLQWYLFVVLFAYDVFKHLQQFTNFFSKMWLLRISAASRLVLYIYRPKRYFSKERQIVLLIKVDRFQARLSPAFQKTTILRKAGCLSKIFLQFASCVLHSY